MAQSYSQSSLNSRLLSSDDDLRSWRTRSGSILKCVPKVFFGGFCWEGFALLAKENNLGDYSPLFLLMTGDWIGVVVGQLLLLLVLLALSSRQCQMLHNEYIGTIDLFMWSTVRVACSSFWSGFGWQAYVNFAEYCGLNFTSAFFMTWTMSGVTFCIAYASIGYTIQKYLIRTDKRVEYGSRDFWHDIEISVAVGCSAACFVGTSVRKEFGDNWLTPLFGEPDEESATVPAMLTAGASTVFGFCICQVLICCFLYQKDSWTDHH